MGGESVDIFGETSLAWVVVGIWHLYMLLIVSQTIKPAKIYIAGPYNPYGENPHNSIRIAHQNVNKAINIGIEIMKKGHYPFVPHLSHYIHQRTPHDFGDFYMEMDFAFLVVCDALFYISPSRGADVELALAKRLNKKIFYNLGEVPNTTNVRI